MFMETLGKNSEAVKFFSVRLELERPDWPQTLTRKVASSLGSSVLRQLLEPAIEVKTAGAPGPSLPRKTLACKGFIMKRNSHNLWLLSLIFFMAACGSSDEPENAADELPIPPQFKSCSFQSKQRKTAKDFGTDRGTPSLLSVVGWAEGLGDCYHYSFAYKPFTSFSSHPKEKICASAYCSTAAGRYQFLAATWEQLAIKNRYPTFEPLYQDEGAWALIREKQVDDTASIYDFPRFKRAMGILGKVWASLPGSTYGQPTRSIEDAWARYQLYTEQP